jgi:hypothetical protein
MRVAVIVLGCTSAVCCALAFDDSSSPRTPGPARITLQDKQIKWSKALDALSKQADIRIADNRGDVDDPTLAVDFERTPFWQALDFLAARGGANVAVAPRGGISLVKRSPEALPAAVSYSGAFRVAVKKINSSLDLESGLNSYSATLEVAWEPSLHPLFLETRPQGMVVKDGDVSLPVAEEGSSLAPVHGVIAESFTVPLPTLPRSTKRIGLLQGNLSALGPSKMLTFDFEALDKLDKGLKDGVVEKKEADGVSCRITRITLVADRWTVQVALDYPKGATKLESFQSWMVNNEIWLEDTEKNRLKSSSYLVESSSPRRAVISYHFTDEGKSKRGLARNWTVHYRTPASIIEMPFSFTFKDVPLP